MGKEPETANPVVRSNQHDALADDWRHSTRKQFPAGADEIGAAMNRDENGQFLRIRVWRRDVECQAIFALGCGLAPCPWRLRAIGSGGGGVSRAGPWRHWRRRAPAPRSNRWRSKGNPTEEINATALRSANRAGIRADQWCVRGLRGDSAPSQQRRERDRGGNSSHAFVPSR